jgi:hypothetical protein
MKLKLLKVYLLLVALVAGLVGARAAGGHGTVRAMLVLASNQKGATDGRLADYEPTLRRILRFESYKLVGEGAASLGGAGRSSVKLGRGHSLEFAAEKSDGKGVRLKVNWAGRRALPHEHRARAAPGRAGGARRTRQRQGRGGVGGDFGGGLAVGGRVVCGIFKICGRKNE